MPRGCGTPRHRGAHHSPGAFGESACRQSRPTGLRRRKTRRSHERRGFAKVEGKQKTKKHPNIVFMLCAFFTSLPFLVRLFYTWFSCSLSASVRESAKSSPSTHSKKPRPEHH